MYSWRYIWVFGQILVPGSCWVSIIYLLQLKGYVRLIKWIKLLVELFDQLKATVAAVDELFGQFRPFFDYLAAIFMILLPCLFRFYDATYASELVLDDFWCLEVVIGSYELRRSLHQIRQILIILVALQHLDLGLEVHDDLLRGFIVLDMIYLFTVVGLL